jgi:hypothetical protein
VGSRAILDAVVKRKIPKNRDTTASSGREVYYLQFSLQAASPETFGYTFVKAALLLINSDTMR